MRVFKWVTEALAAALLLFPAAAADALPAPETIRLPIVMYHDLSNRPETWGPYVVSTEEFEADLRWLRDHGYQTVSIQNLLEQKC